MIKISPELIRKHFATVRRLTEATTNVKQHTRHSKKGKTFSVKSYDREIPREVQRQFNDQHNRLQFLNGLSSGTPEQNKNQAAAKAKAKEKIAAIKKKYPKIKNTTKEPPQMY